NFNYDLYNIQISDDKDFDAIIFDETVIAKRYKIETKLSENITYYWRVRGKNLYSDDEYSDWIIKSKFSVDNSSIKFFNYNIIDLAYYDLPYTGYDNVNIEDYETDEDGIIIFIYNEQTFYNPVRIAQLSLKLIDNFIRTRNSEYLDIAIKHFNKLIELSVEEEDNLFFPYNFYFALHGYSDELMVAPWYSGMAQGQILSLASRLAIITEKENYYKYAEKIYNSIINIRGENTSKIWTSFIDENNFFWISEYPDEDDKNFTLNGFIYAIYGLYDYYILLCDNENRSLKLNVKNNLDKAISTIEYYIESFRVPNEISYYCLKHKVQSGKYHSIHIKQLKQLYLMTQEKYFLEMSSLFSTDY
ncbi:MAG: hypothetical protein GF311_09580, partial [Candidatus Lokiarchaeota archaeon]|nr:hypothetical protein [Candidatus Lokiarchaeota archaeon]